MQLELLIRPAPTRGRKVSGGADALCVFWNAYSCAIRLVPRLQPCLHDSDPEVAARAGAIALAVADQGNKELAAERMIKVLAASDWLLQGEIQGWLEKHLDVALPSINEEIERRKAVPASIQMKDDVLRLLLAVRRKGQRGPDRERNP